MSLVVLTGTLATISNEIDWLIQDDMRVTPGGERVSWGEMENAVRQAAPEDMMVALQRGEGDHFAYRAILSRPDGSFYFLHVDQWTGEITGTTHPLTVQRFLRDLHRYLFMPRAISLPLVCSMGFVLLISMYTGLRTVGRVRTAAARLRTNRGARVLIGDAHKPAGVWTVWFLVVIAVTGIWHLIEFGVQASGGSFEPPRPGPAQESLAERTDAIAFLDADALVARAQQAHPDLEPTRIYYPTRLDAPAMVWGRAGDPLVRDRANRVSLDPVSGEVIQIVRSPNHGALAYINDIADPLHFGSFGALPTKTIWFLFGLALTGLSVTGVWLTYKRLKKTVVSRAQLATLPVLIAVAISGHAYVSRYIETNAPGTQLAAYGGDIGPFSARLAVIEVEPGETTYRLALRHRDGLPSVAEAVVVDGGRTRLQLDSTRFSRRTLHLTGSGAFEPDLSGPIFSKVTTFNGAHHQGGLRPSA